MDNIKPPSPGNLEIPSPQSILFQFPNRIPTPAEESHTHDLLVIAESEVCQLHFDIAILLAKRAHAIKRIKNCKAILSPHKRLPSELISKIFSFVIGKGHAIFPLRHGKLDSRVVITHVCSRWRRIAFDTPNLWDLCFRPFSMGLGIELGASWWSQYSRSKLGLFTTHHPKQIPNSTFHFRLVDKLVLPFIERLRNIHMAVTSRDLKKILSTPPGAFKSLEEISLSVHSKDIDPWSETDTALMSAPNLRSVSLRVDTRSWFFPHLPWEQLTQLGLNTTIPSDIFFVLLASCTSLVSCDLLQIDENLISVPNPGPLPELPLHLPLLDFFGVRFTSGSFSPLLSHLSLPNLTEFLITTNITHHGNQWTRHCGTFFQSMEESLRHVEILSSVEGSGQGNSLDETIFLDFPNIRSFSAPQSHPFSSSTLEKIAQGKLLRKIETLEFYTENAADVVNMLTARQPNASSASNGAFSPITNLQVNCQKSAAGVEEKFNALRLQGVLIDCVVAYDDPHTTSGDSDSEST